MKHRRLSTDQPFDNLSADDMLLDDIFDINQLTPQYQTLPGETNRLGPYRHLLWQTPYTWRTGTWPSSPRAVKARSTITRMVAEPRS
ncbi:MAG: hypothetical protein U0556_00670 [Dehalococcoidia bacterium]